MRATTCCHVFQPGCPSCSHICACALSHPTWQWGPPHPCPLMPRHCECRKAIVSAARRRGHSTHGGAGGPMLSYVIGVTSTSCAV